MKQKMKYALTGSSLTLALAGFIGCGGQWNGDYALEKRESPQCNRVSQSYHQGDMYKRPVMSKPSGDRYERVKEQDSKRVKDSPLSTFSVDVDTASYANVRRQLHRGQLPQRDSVRIEEMINYFDYEYSQPRGEHPVAIHTDYTDCPWDEGKKLVRIAVQGKEVHRAERKGSNLVFLIDVSE